jgi:hypothetical protein
MNAIRKLSSQNTIDVMTDRDLLVAYLEYAVSDVAAIDATSASLLELAIAHLKRPPGEINLGGTIRRMC